MFGVRHTGSEPRSGATPIARGVSPWMQIQEFISGAPEGRHSENHTLQSQQRTISYPLDPLYGVLDPPYP